MHGPLDSAILSRAWTSLVTRHPALCTSFAWNGDVLEQIVTLGDACPLPLLDLSAVPTGERELEFLRRAVADARLPFDLAHGPLWRSRLIRYTPAEHVLHLVIHPLVADRGSIRLLARELASWYAAEGGQGSPPAPPRVQYLDLCVEQRRRLEGGALAEHVEFWRKQLLGVAPVLPLADRETPDAARYQSLAHLFRLPASIRDRVVELARSEQTNICIAMLAAWQALLHVYSDAAEVVVGVPVESAPPEPLVGCFSRLLAARIEFGDDPTFRTLLRRLRELWQAIAAHEDVSCDLSLDAEQTPADLPVFFVFEDADERPMTAAGLTWELEELPGRALPAQLALLASVDRAGLRCALAYRTGRYDPPTIQRMAGHFQNLVAAIAHDPERRLAQIPLLTPAERYQILSEWNATRSRYPEGDCLQQLLEEQAERYPDRPAVVHERGYLSFADLNRRANRLARHLASVGVGPETLVGVTFERASELAVVLLSILKAGGAFVPLDPTAPAEHLRALHADARFNWLVTQGDFGEEFFGGEVTIVRLGPKRWRELEQLPGDNVESRTQPNNLACVLYPAQGTPLGVMLEHRSLVSHVTASGDYCRITPADRVAQSSTNVDSGVEAILGTLARAATLVFVPAGALGPKMAPLLKECRRCEMTVLRLTAGQWQALISALPSQSRLLPSSLRLVVVEATQLTSEAVAVWKKYAAPHIRLVAQYGSPETTLAAVLGDRAGPAATKHGEQGTPLGRPAGNYHAYVVSRDLQPVPVGVPGELLIGGIGVARGYWGRPDATSAVFIPDPFGGAAGGRLFRTGIRVRFRSDGVLEYLR
jgi:amino acid adenylation domain-containing protein